MVHTVGEIHGNDALKMLNFDQICKYHLCDPSNFHAVQTCLRKRSHRYCFEHTAFKKNCDKCLHQCSSGLTDFLLKEVENYDMNFDLRFARLKEFEKNRWLPVRDLEYRNNHRFQIHDNKSCF